MSKKITLSLFLLFAAFMMAFATGPTVPSSNLSFPVNLIDGDRLSLSFHKGDGAFRIVVMKEGSAPTTLPTNGTDYTGSLAFGTAGTEFNSTDGFVVYRGNNSTTTVNLTVTKLKANTRYYVSIYEFNGSGLSTEYLLTTVTGNEKTKAAPTGQASITSFTEVAGNRLKINFTAGNGEKRLIIAHKNSPVNAEPEQQKDYLASPDFGSGSSLNSDNYVVYEGSGSSTTITNLEPNTTYYFSIFEFNGSAGPVYLLPSSTGNQLTHAGPTQASGTINFSSIEGNSLTLSFAKGNGKYQLVIGRKDFPVTAIPQNGHVYTADKDFENGDEIATGEFVLNTVNNDRTFSNLDPATTYYFRVYDYDVDANGNTYYLTSLYSEAHRSTATAPLQQAYDAHFENITGTTANLKYTTGDGDYRLVVMKEGSAVDADPADLTKYNGGSTVFKSGYQITAGNYVLSGQTNSNALSISGLQPGKTYHVAIWGFNGNNGPVYARPPATTTLIIPNQPTEIGENLQISSIEGNSFHVQWSGGDGARRIIIARKDAPVTAVPVDGTIYDAVENFGDGDAVEDGQFVVFDGTTRSANIKNLEIGAIYHLAIFEYNGSDSGPDYLPSQSLTGSGTTLSAPTVQASISLVDNIQDNQAMIHFEAGDGKGRLFIMHAGSPVTEAPQDLAYYGSSQTYGSVVIGTDHCIVMKALGEVAFIVSSLSSNTEYYISVFEYNGSMGPVFLRPGSSYHFTTTGSGITAPMVNASAPSFDVPDGNKLTFHWHNGDGANRIVVMRQGTPVSFNPTDGTDYTANPSFGDGVDQGAGQYIVYKGTQEGITVTNLQPSTNYYFAVFEFNGTGATIKYLAAAGALTANSSTATAPAGGSTGLTGTAGHLSIDLNWNAGPGNGRLVVMKEGGAVMGQPANLSIYPDGSEFKNGAQIAAGEYVVYAGTGSNVTVTGLEENKIYYYAIFEYNGIAAPVYNTANAISGSTLISTSLPLKWLSFTAEEKTDGIHLEWSTTEEYNTSHFIIERSMDNGNFISVGTITAKGGSVRNDYSFLDHVQSSGIVSYRIKQVDIDNRYEYSKQVVLHTINQQGILKLYPNPAQAHTRISLPQNLQQATLRMFDVKGVLVKTIFVTNGQIIELQGLTKGMYHVLINEGAVRYSSKLVIQ